MAPMKLRLLPTMVVLALAIVAMLVTEAAATGSSGGSYGGSDKGGSKDGSKGTKGDTGGSDGGRKGGSAGGIKGTGSDEGSQGGNDGGNTAGAMENLIARRREACAATPRSLVPTALCSTSTAAGTRTSASSPTATSTSTPTSSAYARVAPVTSHGCRPWGSSSALTRSPSPPRRWRSGTRPSTSSRSPTTARTSTSAQCRHGPHLRAHSLNRIGATNAVDLVVREKMGVALTVLPITKEENRVHGYGVTADDCIAHFNMQFRFYNLSSSVNGVLGQKYQPGFVNPVRRGVAMPVIGGADRFVSSSLLSTDCRTSQYTASAIAEGCSMPSFIAICGSSGLPEDVPGGTTCRR